MTWAVVPVKRLDTAKGRLADVFPMNVRMRLTIAMLQDVLASLNKASSIEGIAVVTPDKRLERMILSLVPNVQFILETGRPSLNGALRQAAGLLQSRHRDSMLIIPGDVPLIDAEEINTFVRYSELEKVLIVPDKTSKGTNGLLLNPPLVMEPRFGPDSLKRHMEGAYRKGISFNVYPSRYWGFDLDTPDDLASFLEIGQGTKTYHEIMKHRVCFCSQSESNQMAKLKDLVSGTKICLDNPIRR